MKASLRKPQTATPVFQNTQLLDEYYDFLNLPEDHRMGFAEKPCVSPRCIQSQGGHTHVRKTSIETAYKQHVPVWRRINIVDNPEKRSSTIDVRVINNISFDIDWRPNPEIALEVALIFRQKISDELSTHPDIPIILSGRGVHIIINIPGINVTEDDAELFNVAVNEVVKRKFLPQFEYAKSIVEVQTMLDLSSMKLEGYDIDRLMSAPGDYNPKTESIRTVYQNAPLIRRESEPVRSYIIVAYYKLQEDILKCDEFTETFTFEEEIAYKEIFAAHAHGNDIFKAVKASLEWRINEKKRKQEMPLKSDGEIDYSRLFAFLVWYVASRCRSGTAAYHFRHIIHALCNNKYGSDQRLEQELSRCLRKWPGPIDVKYPERKKIARETKPKKEPAPLSDEMFLLQFVNKMYIRDQDSEIEKASFIQKYTLYCKNQKRVPLSDQKITRQLSQINVKSEQRTVKNQKVRVYNGIKFKFTR